MEALRAVANALDEFAGIAEGHAEEFANAPPTAAALIIGFAVGVHMLHIGEELLVGQTRVEDLRLEHGWRRPRFSVDGGIREIERDVWHHFGAADSEVE